MRGGCVLMTLLAVVVRGLGVLLGLVMLAHIVVMGCLQVVVSGGRVVGGSLEMVSRMRGAWWLSPSFDSPWGSSGL